MLLTLYSYLNPVFHPSPRTRAFLFLFHRSIAQYWAQDGAVEPSHRLAFTFAIDVSQALSNAGKSSRDAEGFALIVIHRQSNRVCSRGIRFISFYSVSFDLQSIVARSQAAPRFDL